MQQESVWWCGGRHECRVKQTEYALGAVPRKGAGRQWLYLPTPKQAEFHAACRRTRRVLYGGQAGPGKSHALRWGLYRDCLTIPNLNCLLLRRTYKQLEQTHLGEMVREQKKVRGVYTSGDKCMRFPNGSVIRAGHCENVGDEQDYLSTEYDRIAFDELVTFDQGPALEIMSRARTSKAEVMAAGDAQVWCGTNPGGRGALWVREFFIDHSVDRAQFPSYDEGRYAFVEATLDDNPYISPEYRRDLEDLPEMRKRQLLYGDWFAFEGQFFSEWRSDVHVRHLELVPGLECFGSIDWGYNAPGCVLWWAALTDGRYHVVREYKFKQQTAEQVGKKVHEITKELGMTVRYIAADPAMWQKTGAGKGESIAETLLRMRLPMRKSDNDRFNGWLRLHELLGQERLTVDPGCRYLTRTLPMMVYSDKPGQEDDLDSAQDDHAVDALRYGAMSRPRPTEFRDDPKTYPVGSWGWHMETYHAPKAAGVLA